MHGKGNGYISLAGAGRAKGESKVVVAELFYQQLLVGRAGRDGLAVDTEDYHVVALHILGCLALDYIQYHILGQSVVLFGVVLQLLDFLFEFRCFRILANHLYDRAACSHSQLRKEVAYQVHIGIVNTIETYRVYLVDDNYAFNHVVNGI